MTSWKNRISGYGEEDPEQLLANPGNWRIHPKAQQDALSGVLSEVGWVQSVIINQRTGFVIDGHLRVALAISAGQKVPVVYVDLLPEEEALILATLDPLAAMAVADKDQLDALLREISTGDASVQAMLGKLAADVGITKFDPQAEWQGMPEYQQEPLAVRTIYVHFKATEDVMAFAILLGQSFTEHQKSIWYPASESYE